MYKRFIWLLSLTSIIGSTALADNGLNNNGRDNYDLDNDGLIEINDLNDLNEIRNNLNGSSLYGQNIGCPTEGCTGFELTTNLDFNTNNDGHINEDDDFWNEGLGWAPIGNDNTESLDTRFASTFEGNGYSIKRNFKVKRSV